MGAVHARRAKFGTRVGVTVESRHPLVGYRQHFWRDGLWTSAGDAYHARQHGRALDLVIKSGDPFVVPRKDQSNVSM